MIVIQNINKPADFLMAEETEIVVCIPSFIGFANVSKRGASLRQARTIRDPQLIMHPSMLEQY